MLTHTFNYSRSNALDRYLGLSGVPDGTCLACHWRQQQRDGEARCVRVALSEEGGQ